NYSEVIGTAQWRCTGLQPRIGGEESEFAGGRVERDNLRRWISSVHLRFVQCPDAGILKGSAGRIVKHVGGHVNAIRPNAKLWIVVETTDHADGIEVPASGHVITRPRDREALKTSGRIDNVSSRINFEGKVSNEPAILDRKS